MDYFYTILITALFALCSGEGRRVVMVKEVGLNVKVNCTILPLTSGSIDYWILNEGSRAKPGFGAQSTISISDDGETLEIKKMANYHVGTYTCVVGNGTSIIANHAIDISLYTGELWENYKTNTIVACVSAAACALICIFVCLVYNYRWRPTKLTATEIIVANEEFSANGAAANTPKHSSNFSNNSVAPEQAMDTKL